MRRKYAMSELMDKITLVQKQVGCTILEAKKYIELAEGDVDIAVALYYEANPTAKKEEPKEESQPEVKEELEAKPEEAPQEEAPVSEPAPVRRRRRRFPFFIFIIVGAVIALILSYAVIIPKAMGAHAGKLIKEGKYDEAVTLLDKDFMKFKDEKMLALAEAGQSFQNGNYESGIGYIARNGGKVEVDLDPNGGYTSRTHQTIQYVQYIYKTQYILERAEKDGYRFVGWHLIDFEINVDSFSADIKLKAGYELEYYYIEYHDVNPYEYDYPDLYTIEDNLTLTSPTREGYIFEGWSINDYSGPIVQSIPAGTYGYLDLYAHWTPIAFRVNLNADGGTLSQDYFDCYYGAFYELPIPTDKLNCYFDGWYLGDQKIENNAYWYWSTSSCELVAHWENYLTIKDGVVVNCLNTATNIEIPSDVTGIGGSAFSDCDRLETLVIPDGVTSIGEYAFYSCNSLKSVVIGSNVTTIGNYAFCFCNKLVSVIIPDSVTSMGEHAFYDCNSLKSVSLGSGLTTISPSAFQKCSSLESIVIPNSVVSIGNKAFEECSSLTSITLGNSLNEIGHYAFRGASLIKSIVIPDSVTSIGNGVFGGWSSLESITLPFVGMSASSTSYAYSLFGYVFGGDEFSGGVKTIQQYSNESNASFYIPHKLQTVTITGGNLGFGAFSNCNYLTSITLPNSVTSIGACAFKGCSSLTSLDIPNGVISIGQSAFADCSSLTGITLPNNLTSIGANAFANCKLFTSIVIPSNVTSIGAGALSGCSALESITIPFIGSSTSTYSSSGSFGYIFGTTPYDGASATRQYSDSTSFVEYYIPDSLTTVTVAGGKIGYGAFYNCTKLTTITLGDNVTSMGDYAFYNCSSLRDINMGSGITTLGKYTFANCSDLRTITLGSGLTNLGTYTFNDCSRLKTIVLSEGVTKLNNTLFTGCSALETINIPNSVVSVEDDTFPEPKGLNATNYDHAFYLGNESNPYLLLLYASQTYITSCEVHPNCKFIYNGAFKGCTNLTSLVIPDNVQYIGYGALEGCNSLASLTIPFVGATANENAGPNSCLGYLFGKNGSYGNIADQYYSATEHEEYYLPASLTSVTVTGGKVNYGAFSNCAFLEEVNLGANVTSIGANILYGCKALKKLSVTSISNLYLGEYFGKTEYVGSTKVTQNNVDYYIPSMLNEVTVLKGTIKTNAFANLTMLKTVTIGSEVTSISSAAFRGCSYLKTLTIPFIGSSNSSSGGYSSTVFGYIFGTTEFDNATATKQYYKSGSYSTFYIPNSLTSVTVTGGKLYYGSFNNCTHLDNVTISSGVGSTEDSDNVFSGCTYLSKVTIEGGVTNIGSYCFNNCTYLSTLYLPSSITNIEGYAFNNCGLITINYDGIKGSWNVITKNSNWNTSGHVAYIECTNGTITL